MTNSHLLLRTVNTQFPEFNMKLQLTILLFCITMAVARPSCRGKRSPGPCPPRKQSSGTMMGSGRSGRANNLQDGLRSLQLNTLLSLIEATGLVGALSGNSDLTLFAPTDAALATFIQSLPSAPDTATVKKVLLNHVISGKVESGTVATLDGKKATNLDGNQMTIRVNPKPTSENPTGITIGGARVSKVDLPVLRLTVHILDDVINPFELGTVQEGLKGLRLLTLATLLEGADLIGALSGNDDLTLFAPTDAALDRFIKSLPSAPDAATVKTVLLNHVIPGKAVAADISDGLTVKNLAGNDMTFRVTNTGVTIGGARVARTDFHVRRMTIHVLDDVINPANLPGRR